MCGRASVLFRVVKDIRPIFFPLSQIFLFSIKLKNNFVLPFDLISMKCVLVIRVSTFPPKACCQEPIRWSFHLH